MNRVSSWNQQLTSRALDGLGAIDGITIYGPRDAARRTSLVAFNLAGHDPVSVAHALDRAGVESRAGCHCATLAHHALQLTPPASCRLSFYLYNTPDEVDRAVTAVAAIAADRVAPRYRWQSWQAGLRSARLPVRPSHAAGSHGQHGALRPAAGAPGVSRWQPSWLLIMLAWSPAKASGRAGCAW